MTRIVLLAALVFVPAALATHPSGPYVTRRANLDGDRAGERAVGWLDVDSRHTYSRWSVTIEDRCRGRWKRYPVSSVWNGAQALETLRAPNADGLTARHEVFYVLRSGQAQGEAAVVGLDNRRPCPGPRFLFRYVASKSPGISSFAVELGDFDPRVRGLEIRIEEHSPDLNRFRFYRYDRRAGRYALYRTTQA